MERTMNSLPVELLPFIFKNLSIYDLISLSSVCKRLHRSIKSFRIEELIINNNYGLISVWFHTNRLPNYNNCLFQDLNLKFLKNEQFNLRSLKRLKISYRALKTDKITKFKLGVLNNFSGLVELELKLNDFKSDETLELNNLEILFIELKDSTVKELIAPKLKALYLDYYYSVDVLESVGFRTPETVIYLETNGCLKDLDKFKNVECFKTSTDIYKDLFVLFPKIKEAHFATSMYEGSEEDLGLFLNDVAVIETKKPYYDKQDLVLYFFELKLTKDQPINGDDYFIKRFYMQMNNYNLLAEKLTYYTKINYDKLTNYIDNLPADWFDKFSNIYSVYAADVKNQEQFIEFVTRLKNLNRLELNDSNLNQEFYNLLPTIKSITQLNLIESKEMNFNFDFINRIQLLQIYHSNQPLTIDQVLNAFIKSPYLMRLSITNDEHIFAYKENGYFYFNYYKSADDGRKLIKKKCKLNQLIKLAEKNNFSNKSNCILF